MPAGLAHSPPAGTGSHCRRQRTNGGSGREPRRQRPRTPPIAASGGRHAAAAPPDRTPHTEPVRWALSNGTAPWQGRGVTKVVERPAADVVIFHWCPETFLYVITGRCPLITLTRLLAWMHASEVTKKLSTLCPSACHQIRAAYLFGRLL